MRLNLSYACLILLILPSIQSFGQLFDGFTSTEGYSNFVPNHSFEETKREYCVWNQKGRAYMEDVIYWDSPNEATPDILSTRLKPTCWANPRKHSGGKQGPKSG